jgi:hypothetical protein
MRVLDVEEATSRLLVLEMTVQVKERDYILCNLKCIAQGLYRLRHGLSSTMREECA